MTDLPSFAAGITWLREHADGLIEAPIRVHSWASEGGRHTSPGSPVFHSAASPMEHDGLGGPPFTAAMIAVLDGGPYSTTTVRETRDCPLEHPLDAICERCGNHYTYVVTREVYRHPLAAALERLKHVPATSPSWPTPYQLVVALLHSGGSLGRAAELIGRPVTSADSRQTTEAAFLLALRKLAGRYASGPVPKMAKAA